MNPRRLQTTLDRLPYGEEITPDNIKVNRKIPDGVRAGELYKDIIRIAWPSFIELLLTQLVSMVDLMMVGSIGGKNSTASVQALSAVGLTTQPKFLLMTAFIAMNTGVTALIARYKGKNDRENANLILRQGMMFTFLATVIVSVLGVIFARPMVIFMGSTEETVTVWATQYLQIQMAGFLTMALTSTVTAALRAVGDSRTCMVYNLVANGVNVVFNWLLIYGNLGFPEMGVAGASLATIIGQFVAFIMAMSIIVRGNGFLKLEFGKGFRPNKEALSNMFHIGFPAMVEQLLMRVGMVIFSKTIASLGTAAYATHQVCMNILALSFMTGQAFAVSATTLVGQSLGKKRQDMAQAYCSRTCYVGLVSAAVLFVIFIFWGSDIITLYNEDPGIVATGAKIMFFVAFMQPFQTMQFITAGGLRGAGDTRVTAIITSGTILLMRPTIAILLVNMGWGLAGAWTAFALDQLARTFLIMLRYNSGKWKLIKIKNQK